MQNQVKAHQFVCQRNGKHPGITHRIWDSKRANGGKSASLETDELSSTADRTSGAARPRHKEPRWKVAERKRNFQSEAELDGVTVNVSCHMRRKKGKRSEQQVRKTDKVLMEEKVGRYNTEENKIQRLSRMWIKYHGNKIWMSHKKYESSKEVRKCGQREKCSMIADKQILWSFKINLSVCFPKIRSDESWSFKNSSKLKIIHNSTVPPCYTWQK